MPKRTDIESILIIGAGPIIIGQACFEKNWNANKLVNIADKISLTAGFPVLAFKDFLDESGIQIN